MSDFNNYFEYAFYNTLVPSYLANNIYAITGTGKVYYDDGTGVKTFTSEEKALTHLLKTLDISGHYRFFDVYYDVLPSADGKNKYTNYMCLVMRKTKKTRNQVYDFFTSPNLSTSNDADGKLIADEEFIENITKDTAFSSASKDLTRVCGMSREALKECEFNVDDKTYYDIRDNFIIKEILPEPKNENKITINLLFNHINTAYKLATTYVNAEDKTQVFPEMTLIDVTGSIIKTTLDDINEMYDMENITINDSLDIYREFLGGTNKSEEDFPVPTPEDDTDIRNDSEYV